jgi:hypothetical protein
MLQDGLVALDHLLVAGLRLVLAGVVELVADPLVEVAVLFPTGRIREDQHVRCLRTRTDPALTAASVEAVKPGPLDLLFRL